MYVVFEQSLKLTTSNNDDAIPIPRLELAWGLNKIRISCICLCIVVYIYMEQCDSSIYT